jgi:hypothetical protein
MILPEIKLNGWITIKMLAAEKGCSTQYISAQIRRKEIPFIEFPELNNIKLVPSMGLQQHEELKNKWQQVQNQKND